MQMQSGLGLHMSVLQRRSINIDILNCNRICIYIRSCSFECRRITSIIHLDSKILMRPLIGNLFSCCLEAGII